MVSLMSLSILLVAIPLTVLSIASVVVLLKLRLDTPRGCWLVVASASKIANKTTVAIKMHEGQ